MGTQKPYTPNDGSARRSALAGAASAFGWIGRIAGGMAAILTMVLTVSILLGIVLRELSINNAWTYDIDHFGLVWLAFLGAAYTGYHAGHVTAGISLEHLFGRGAIVLVLIRFVLVAGFLIIFIWSGYLQFHSSWLSHETTVDLFQWPVWVAKFALPVGGAAWLAGELHKFLASLAEYPTSATAD